MQQIEDADAGEGLRVEVGEDGAGAAGVHGAELRDEVVELGEGVDGDEEVGELEVVAVPEDHPGADAEVADGVVGDVGGEDVEFGALGGLGGGEFVEAVEPGELDELLGGEESADELGLGTVFLDGLVC